MIYEPVRTIIPGVTRLLFVILLGLLFNGASPVVAQAIAAHHVTIADFVVRLGSATIGYGLMFAVLLRAEKS